MMEQVFGEHGPLLYLEEVPHCFNAYDAVDLEEPPYEGLGWYRRKLQIRNPFERGRTLLLFERAGQKCQIFLSLERVGEHVGGYDEFVVDITERRPGPLKLPRTQQSFRWPYYATTRGISKRFPRPLTIFIASAD